MDLSKDPDRRLETAEIMVAGKHESLNSSMGRNHAPHRHTFDQTQRLEGYFEECQRPTERHRYQLGKELRLTPTQIKYWFQNKRTLLKAQNGREAGNALREENERLKMENFENQEILKDEFSCRCNGISKEVHGHILKLQIEKSQLIDKYEQLSNLLNSMGIWTSKRFSLPYSLGSSTNPQENLLGKRIGGISLHPNLGSTNHDDHIQLYREKQLEYSDMSHMALTISKAANELSRLLGSEPLWIKDPTNRRYIIHRKNYEKTFTRINHLKSSHARFESSKMEGLVRMNATQLVEMLLDSTTRQHIFPTIITKATTLQEITARRPGNPNGSFHLEYEQMHILSPFVAPRDFYFLRYCHQMGIGEWMIVEVSYDIFHGSREIDCHSHSWRLPSGCLVRDLLNGCSMITWVEHIEVDDEALTHQLYRDFICYGLAYGAERWLLTLQRMCERFYQNKIESRDLREGRRSIMNLSHRMVKNLCTNLWMKNKLDIPHLPENNNIEIRFSIFTCTVGGQTDGLIVNAATSIWLPLSCPSVFEFLRDEKTRAQWDVLAEGISFQEIAKMSYGDHPGNSVSIIQPIISSGNNILVLQDSSIDPLGAIVAYAPIDIASLDIAVRGGDSSNIPVLPSGFIISSDGHPGTITNTSSSTTTYAEGSLLTVVFQIQDCDASSPKHVSMEMVASVHALISSTVQSIKSALKCTSFN